MSESSAAKARKQRTSRPKTRTGCITCKRRRVKCDEGKPGCLRCQNFGFQCDGYATDEQGESAGQSTSRRGSKTLLPKTALALLPPSSGPKSPQFANDQQYRYFRVFCDQTVLSLSGFFDEPLWGRLVLQACEFDSSIRHAVVAIGALDKTLDVSSQARSDTAKQSDEPVTAENHYNFAVQQYGEAIKGMRDFVAKGSQDLRTTLISCLLAVCFELFHGNMQSALAQAQSGLKLINQRLKDAKRPVSSGTATELPMPKVIDDELIQVFARFDIQAISSKISKGVEIDKLTKSNEELSEDMPTTFPSFAEARIHWELLLRQTLHWTVTAYFWGSGLEPHLEGITIDAGPLIDDSKPWTSTSSPLDRKNILDQQTKHLTTLTHWSQAFDLLLTTSRSPTSSPKTLAHATALHLGYLAAHLALHSSLFKPETQFDAQTAIFEEILSLAQLLLSHLASPDPSQRQKPTFTLDSVVIGPLYVVAALCRVPTLRRKAMQLLEEHPRREGVWDSVVAARAARIVMGVEEATMVDGAVPEHGRVRVVKLTSDLQRRKAVLCFLVPERGTEEGFLVRRVGFAW